MTKRNKSHVNTFNGKNVPLSWTKKLVSKVNRFVEQEERRQQSRFPTIIHRSLTLTSNDDKDVTDPSKSLIEGSDCGSPSIRR